MCARERSESVGLQEVEHALPIEVCDDADVILEVEAIPQVYASVPVLLVVR